MKVPARAQKPFGRRFPAFQASERRKNEGWVANGAERLRTRAVGSISRLRAPLEQCSGPRSQQVAATCLASGARSREAAPRYFAECDGYQSSSAQGVTGTSERPQFRTKTRMRAATSLR
jgi:hypothetical protein